MNAQSVHHSTTNNRAPTRTRPASKSARRHVSEVLAAVRRVSRSQAPVSLRLDGQIFDAAGLITNGPIDLISDSRRSHDGRSWVRMCATKSAIARGVAKGRIRASDLLIIGDEVWKSAAEPVIAAQRFGAEMCLLPTRTEDEDRHETGARLSASFCPRSSTQLPVGMTSVWFRADRQDAAAAFAQSFGLKADPYRTFRRETTEAMAFDERSAAVQRFLEVLSYAGVSFRAHHEALHDQIEATRAALRKGQVRAGAMGMKTVRAVKDAIAGLNPPMGDQIIALAGDILIADAYFAKKRTGRKRRKHS